MSRNEQMMQGADAFMDSDFFGWKDALNGLPYACFCRGWEKADEASIEWLEQWLREKVAPRLAYREELNSLIAEIKDYFNIPAPPTGKEVKK